jgi:hypothetical protein
MRAGEDLSGCAGMMNTDGKCVCEIGGDGGGAVTANSLRFKTEAGVRQIHSDTVDLDYPLLKSGDQ